MALVKVGCLGKIEIEHSCPSMKETGGIGTKELNSE